jgi:hypothetical protein
VALEQQAVAIEPDVVDEAVPFVCECGDAGCAGALTITVEEYEAAHSTPNRFTVKPGHLYEDASSPPSSTTATEWLRSTRARCRPTESASSGEDRPKPDVAPSGLYHGRPRWDRSSPLPELAESEHRRYLSLTTGP